MPVIPELAELHQEMREWRRHLHMYPETAFEEVRTSEFVAEKLQSFGLEVHRGLAKTGVVGVLRSGSSKRSVGLRADMDALDIQELNDVPYKSKIDGKMHGCGHDGHTAMLLGAAKYFSEHKSFDGTIVFIFQPAEENLAGAKVMIDEGLFEQFPVDAVFALHNYPGDPIGTIGTAVGPVGAAADFFSLEVVGKGGHGAYPHFVVDPIAVSSEIIQNWQTIVSRRVDPIKPAVVTVTQIHGGDSTNVVPERVTLAGTTRAFEEDVQDLIESSMKSIAENVAAAHGASVKFTYERRYAPTVNSPAETDLAVKAAQAVVGSEHVVTDVAPTMGAEDFGWMQKVKPGCYVRVGAGEDRAFVHNPHFDFNDEILPIGASFLANAALVYLSGKAPS